MTKSAPISFNRFMDAITQIPGDPTFSVLKAHLVFEEMLRAYVDRELPNSAALDGARLTFAQVLAVARACDRRQDATWHWDAIAKLNTIRNRFAHKLKLEERQALIGRFVTIVTSNGVPMPAPTTMSFEAPPLGERYFLEIDMAMGALFSFTTSYLGFEMDFD